MPADWDADAYSAGSSVQTAEGLRLLSRLPARPAGAPPLRLLDLGCGDGRVTAVARERGYDVVGLDPSPAMVRAARSRGLEVVRASATAPPFADATFDLVISNAALHWVHDHDEVVEQVARVLRPGGRLVARLGGAGNQSEVMVAAFRLLAAAPYARYRPAAMRSPWRMGDPGVWAAALVRNGLAVHELRLEHTAGDWSSVAEMRRWFVPIATGFTSVLPVELRSRFVDDVLATVWGRVDPSRAFVRLVVEASLMGDPE